MSDEETEIQKDEVWPGVTYTYIYTHTHAVSVDTRAQIWPDNQLQFFSYVQCYYFFIILFFLFFFSIFFFLLF